jgi:hypothetical protein
MQLGEFMRESCYAGHVDGDLPRSIGALLVLRVAGRPGSRELFLIC